MQDPTRPVIYASVYNENAVAVVDTRTLTYQLVPIGSNPIGMALSPDASKLYVATSGSSFINVMDTNALSALSPVLVPGTARPIDVAFGTNNRLFVLAGGVQQIDAATGTSTGPNVNGLNINGGTIEISPDRGTLYYGPYGMSPTMLFKIDASSSTPSVIKSIQTGSSGRDVALSHDGSLVSQPNGSPYAIGLLRASDLVTLGTLNTDAYPVEIAFSPDDLVAYTYIFGGGIKTFSTSTFLSIGPTISNGVGTEMIVDSSGTYLFASGTTTTVYDTGRAVPEPGSLSLLALIGGALVLRRARTAPARDR